MGVKDMIDKIRQALKAHEAKKAAETSRMNLDAELEAVRAQLDAEAIEEGRKERAGKGG